MSNGQRNDDLISAYHDGELTAADRDLAERLLDESADLRSELDDYRQLSAMLSALPREDAPSDLRDAVMQQIAQSSVAASQAPVPTGVLASRQMPAVETAQHAVAMERPAQRRAMRMLWLLAGGLTSAAAVVLAVNLFDGSEPKSGTELARSEVAPFGAGPVAGGDAAHNGFVATSGGAATDLAMPMATSDSRALGDSIRILRDEARPPDDVLPGDIYRYFEHSPDGVVVVDATVVDVRRAIGRVQYLLQTNSIPTVPVDASPGEPDDQSAYATAANGNWGVYIETDPEQMNLALQALTSGANEDKNLFLDFKVAGVLDAPPAAAYATSGDDRSGTMAFGMLPDDRRLDEESPVDEPAASAGPAEAAITASPADRGAGAPRTMGARSRLSVPSYGQVPSAPDSVSPRMAADSDVGEAESLGSTVPPPENLAILPRADGNEGLSNNYQQVLQLSKKELQQQLRRTNRDNNEYAEGTPGNQHPQQQNSATSQKMNLQRQFNSERESDTSADAFQQTDRRTVRLLLILEADPTATRTFDAGITPVEAPR